MFYVYRSIKMSVYIHSSRWPLDSSFLFLFFVLLSDLRSSFTSNVSALLLFVCQFLFFSLSPFEKDSILFFPSVCVLISSSSTPWLFAFSFRRSRRHHTCIHILQIRELCVYVDKRNFENQLLIHIECWSQES